MGREMQKLDNILIMKTKLLNKNFQLFQNGQSKFYLNNIVNGNIDGLFFSNYSRIGKGEKQWIGDMQLNQLFDHL